MPKKADELTPLQLKRKTEDFKKPGMYSVGGVAGLYFRVTPAGTCNWILRANINGKRCDMGLGGFPDVGLADARKRAKEEREKIDNGVDRIAERRTVRSDKAAERVAALTFEQCAHKYIDAKSPEWKNAKHLGQWRTTLEMYAFPVLGKVLVRDVAQPQVLQVLEPIWHTKTETAKRLRGRIENILDWAAARGFRAKSDNPARWRGHLDMLLAAPKKIAKPVHHPALPYTEVGEFMVELSAREGISALALRFCIFTAVRSGEVRGCTWDEIDLRSKLWVIPAKRMKAGREHRVPLSTDAIAILKTMKEISSTGLVFPSAREDRPLSDMSLTAVLRRMGRADITVHGFRSTFRDWAAETTAYPREMAEMALAHTISDATEAAYRRGDMLQKRFRMMEDWARYCATVQGGRGQVVPIGRRR